MSSLPDPIPPQLDYAPAPSRTGREALVRIGRGILVSLLLFAGLMWGPGIWRQGKFLYGQRRAMAFSLPADQLVYTNRPAEEKGLATERFKPVFVRTQIGQDVHGGVGNPQNALGYAFPPLDALGEGTVAGYASSGLVFQRSSIGMTVTRTGAFLHGRQAVGATERLVGVFFADCRSTTGDSILELNALTWEPATWAGDPALRLTGMTKFKLAALLDQFGAHRVRVFAGHPSAAADQFTIRYEIDGVGGTVEATLDPSDAVQFRVLDGPAKQTVDKLNHTGF